MRTRQLKKVISILMVAMLLSSVLSTAASAVEAESVGANQARESEKSAQIEIFADASIYANSTGTAVPQTEQSDGSGDSSQDKTSFKVIDVDPGDYQPTMTAGTTQLLASTAIYMELDTYLKMLDMYNNVGNKSVEEAGEEGYEDFLNWMLKPGRNIQLKYADMRTSDIFLRAYSSSKPSVATVNALGRITAVSPGTAKIFIRYGDYTKTLSITVKKKKTESVDSQTKQSGEIGDIPHNTVSSEVIDIDPGDYQATMTKGTTQLLMPTAIYKDLSTSERSVYTYSSSKKSIITVNALGRVTAVSPGIAKIFIKCVGFTKKISITVEKEEVESVVAVTDLDFGDYDDTLEVGKTLSLSVSVIPSNAADATITYQSSNAKVATVNGNGQVTGVSAGTVQITAKAGGIKNRFR